MVMAEGRERRENQRPTGRIRSAWRLAFRLFWANQTYVNKGKCHKTSCSGKVDLVSPEYLQILHLHSWLGDAKEEPGLQRKNLPLQLQLELLIT